MSRAEDKRKGSDGAGCAVVLLLILFVFYVIIDSHYDQIDTSEIKNLESRVEALEQKVKQP